MIRSDSHGSNSARGYAWTPLTVENHEPQVAMPNDVALSRLGRVAGRVCLGLGWAITAAAAVFAAQEHEALHDMRLEMKHMKDTLEHPYRQITRVPGHVLPEMVSNVKEKTIWSFWYDQDVCQSSMRCELPPIIQLCTETVAKNKGGFDYRILHVDEVPNFVSRLELPVFWEQLTPEQMKDSLMNALLARYGGVALDMSVMLLQPLDRWWSEMVAAGAIFKGYAMRLNTQAWPDPLVMPVWFLMARREGIFRIAAADQVMRMGDEHSAQHYALPSAAFGDETLTPIIIALNASIPKCFEDPAVRHPDQCPDRTSRENIVGEPPLDLFRIQLNDPRDGPAPRFAWEDAAGVALWNVSDNRRFSGCRPECCSMQDCWQKVWAPRTQVPGLTPMVKLFKTDSVKTRALTRQRLLSQPDTFLCGWLEQAGLSMCSAILADYR